MGSLGGEQSNRGATCSGCLAAFGVAPSMTASAAKCKTPTINAGDIDVIARHLMEQKEEAPLPFALLSQRKGGDR